MNRNEQKVLSEALGMVVEKDKRIAELESDLGNTERCEQAQIDRANKLEQRITKLEGFNFGLATESQEKQQRIAELQFSNSGLEVQVDDLHLRIAELEGFNFVLATKQSQEQQERIKELEEFKRKVFEVYPNIDLDIGD